MIGTLVRAAGWLELATTLAGDCHHGEVSVLFIILYSATSW